MLTAFILLLLDFVDAFAGYKPCSKTKLYGCHQSTCIGP